ncbi:MAG: ATPase domain-containing protein [Opitutaceae bacterium]|nr:ATPase domain-containing protein [Opitutaceae bacterium]
MGQPLAGWHLGGYQEAMTLEPSLSQNAEPLCPTGVEGLDHILRGGLPANRVYLLRGAPGVGKTTLALQYLLKGAEQGEPGLYLTLSETREEIEGVARSHGWNLDKIAIFELSMLEEHLKQETQNTVFYPFEVELNKTTDAMLAKIEEIKPRRIALDSLSELRLLADSTLRYRRQMLALKHYFGGKKITVLLLDDHVGIEEDLQVQSIAHGVIVMELLALDYGAKRRRLEVAKLRGVNFVGGYHDMSIVPGGMKVFPRLIAAEHQPKLDLPLLTSGNADLDKLLGGGIERGASCLLLGPAGTGKSTLAMQFATAAADRGEKASFYLFDEGLEGMVKRGEALGMTMGQHLATGMITTRQIDPAEMAPGEFVNLIRHQVEKGGSRVIIIDSLNGYLHAMPAAKYLAIQLHELQRFLAGQGVVTLLTVTQHGLLGQMQTPIDLTYLADVVLLLRYFELQGEIRKALSVVKNRGGKHETTIREFRFSPSGIDVGDPLKDFAGVLTGVPIFTGDPKRLAQEQ